MIQRNIPRKINYLRVSVTDKCNLRCMYCMPESGVKNKTHDEILTFEETARLVRIFASLGVDKIRITGGEPLVRKGVTELIRDIAQIKSIRKLCLTTNGILLEPLGPALKTAGLNSINISLDTLRRDKFTSITKMDSFDRVIEGLNRAVELEFDPLKVNVVVMKGINDDEIIDFVDFAVLKKIDLRFIEFMSGTTLWDEQYFMPSEEVMRICKTKYQLRKVMHKHSGPAVNYMVSSDTAIGFIKTHSDRCAVCTRLRLTSTGEMKICLYEDNGLLLRDMLRSGTDDDTLKGIISKSMGSKDRVDHESWDSRNVYMSTVGG